MLPFVALAALEEMSVTTTVAGLGPLPSSETAWAAGLVVSFIVGVSKATTA
jgi:hypothetical protein